MIVPEELSLSRSRLAKLILEGRVRLNGTVEVSPKAKVAAQDVIEVSLPEPKESHILPENIPLEIVFEDGDLMVIDKPAGMIVHPAPGKREGTLVNAVLAHCGSSLSGIGGTARPGIVHRIDKDTSGLIVVAKSDAAHMGLAQQFAAHSVERLYHAICFGAPNPGDPRLRGLRGVHLEQGGIIRISTALDRHRTERTRQRVVFQGGRHATTRVRVLTSFTDAAHVSCTLETGRTHQIRVQMAYIGHGLIGDPVYGRSKRLSGLDLEAPLHRQALHAATLGFIHPISGEYLRFESDLPTDMKKVLYTLTNRRAKT